MRGHGPGPGNSNVGDQERLLRRRRWGDVHARSFSQDSAVFNATKAFSSNTAYLARCSGASWSAVPRALRQAWTRAVETGRLHKHQADVAGERLPSAIASVPAVGADETPVARWAHVRNRHSSSLVAGNPSERSAQTQTHDRPATRARPGSARFNCLYP